MGCALAGKRQMIVVGGVLPSQTATGWLSPDPWKQGINVFDLPTLSWKSSYDPDADAYESPQVVQDWYGNG